MGGRRDVQAGVARRWAAVVAVVCLLAAVSVPAGQAWAQPGPSVRIVAPDDGAMVGGKVLEVSVAFAASAAPGDRSGRPTGSVHTVVLDVDGDEVGRYDNLPQRREGTHTFTIDLSAQADGPVVLQAHAYQGNRRAGLRGSSARVTVTVDRNSAGVATVAGTVGDDSGGLVVGAPVAAYRDGEPVAGAVTDPAGVELFAARSDTPFTVVGSLLSLGGIWNAQALPPGFEEPLPAAGRLLLSLAALAGFAWLMLRGPRPAYGLGLAAAAAAGFALALVGTVPAGRELLQALIGAWPGFGPLRDGQLYIAPLALLQAVGVAGVVQWFAAPAEEHTTGVQRPRRVSSRLPALSGVGLAALCVALLPGLLWGAGGRLTPVEYPAAWREVQRLLDEDPRPGAVLSLPWSAHRGIGWGPGERRVVLDPAVKLVERPVLWNDGLSVEVDSVVRVVAGRIPRLAGWHPPPRRCRRPWKGVAGRRALLRSWANTVWPSSW
jgi:hypothetical protein